MSEGDRISELRQETGQVKELLHQNIDKLSQREENLESLSDRSQILQENSRNFTEISSRLYTLQRQYWWRSVCIWALFWIILVVILGCLVAWLVASYNERDD